jgi:integrase
VDDLTKRDLKPSTVRNAIDPLRRIFDRAVKRDLIPYSPCQHLDMPHGTGKREHVATPAEANALVQALPPSERALWAAAFFAGLRMGELRALRWSDVDLAENVLRVCRSWDDDEGEQDSAKTVAGTRTVGIVPALRPHLVAHKLATGRGGNDLVFGRTADRAMIRTTIRSRARRAWKAAKLVPITPHECRHTFASMMLAAGVDRGEVMRQMGHAGTAVLDRYTHGIDDSVAEAARRFQTYLDAHTGEATG